MLSVTKQMKPGKKILKNITSDKTQGSVTIQLNSQFNSKFYRLSASLSAIMTAIKLKNTEYDSVENFANVLPYVPLIHTTQMLNYLLRPTSDICNMFELINIGLYIDEETKFKRQIKKVLVTNDCDILEKIKDAHIIYMDKSICDRNVKLIKTLYINKLININLTRMQRSMQQKINDNDEDIKTIAQAIRNIEDIIQRKIYIKHNETESIITFDINAQK